MKCIGRLLIGLAVAVGFAGQAHAYTETGESRTVTATGVLAASTSFGVVVVNQGIGGAATLGFESVTNAFIDSGEALEVSVDTNLAGNRIIIYTDNFASLSFAPCFDSANTDPILGPIGNDGGGLVGQGAAPNCETTVPLLWAINNLNVDHSFTTGAIGDDEIFIVDKAHRNTFDPAGLNGPLDNQAFVRCDDQITVVPNAPGDLLYPQHFGLPGSNEDLCDAASTTTVLSQELNKNIAVTAHTFFGPNGTAPNLSTPDPADSISVTSPYYLAIGADFTFAPGGITFGTDTLTIELITQ